MTDDGCIDGGFYWINKSELNKEFIVRNYKQSRQHGSFGTHGKNPGQFLDPHGISSFGNLVCVTDPMKNTVSIFDTERILKQSTDRNTPGRLVVPMKEIEFSSVFDVTVHASTNSVLVTDPVEKCIHCISIDDSVVNTPSLFNSDIYLQQFDSLSGITVTKEGIIGAVDSETGRVLIFDSKGNIRHIFGKEGHSNGEFCLPQFICWDEFNQRLFVADTANSRVQAFTLDGRFLFSFGEFGFKKNESYLKYPSGI